MCMLHACRGTHALSVCIRSKCEQAKDFKIMNFITFSRSQNNEYCRKSFQHNEEFSLAHLLPLRAKLCVEKDYCIRIRVKRQNRELLR